MPQKLIEKAWKPEDIYCVEIYLPKRLRYLPELYEFLRRTLGERKGYIVLDGFSIYEVDGAFRGKKDIWEERSLVIRLLLPRSSEEADEHRVVDIGREIAGNVAPGEEEIWITYYPQRVAKFRR